MLSVARQSFRVWLVSFARGYELPADQWRDRRVRAGERERRGIFPRARIPIHSIRTLVAGNRCERRPAGRNRYLPSQCAAETGPAFAKERECALSPAPSEQCPAGEREP